MIVEALGEAGGRVYLVGGAVRDRLLGREVKDLDLLVTGLSAERLAEILSRFGKVHAVGRSFGVLKLRTDARLGPGGAAGEVDVALPRREVSTGAGHRDFEVDFDPRIPVEEDLGRRDFTVNAMAAEVLGDDLEPARIVDPWGGREDLAARRLRMVFSETFREDPLRLLRAVQFSARFGLEVEKKTLERMTRDASLVRTVSPERIAAELGKLMSAPKPSVGFRLMERTGILQPILPEVSAMAGVEQPLPFHDADVLGHTLKSLDAARGDAEIEEPGHPDLMWAVLLHDAGKPEARAFSEKKGRVTFYGHARIGRRLALGLARRLKLSTAGADPGRVARLVERHMFDARPDLSDKALRRFVRKTGVEDVFILLDLRIADVRGQRNPGGVGEAVSLRRRIRKMLEAKEPFGLKDLAVSGRDLIALGCEEGPRIGRILGELLDLAIENPELNRREELLKRARTLSGKEE